MNSVGRLLLRFILIPFGYLVAVIAGSLVILFGSWKMAGGAASDTEGFAFGFVFMAPVLIVMLLSIMWLPGAIGVLVSETFAIRSWIFHAGNGAVSALIGWNLFGYMDDSRITLDHPPAVIAAGLAGGFAYWAIAGCSAGFWKPLLRSSQAVPASARPPGPREMNTR